MSTAWTRPGASSSSSASSAGVAGGLVAGGADVSIQGLRWRPYGRSRPVLADLDLHIDAGQRVLLAGPSGSGKSTLLRAIAGLLLTADSGELAGDVRVGGASPQEHAGAVGLVLQDPGAGVVASTIGRDVAFGLENVSVPREQIGPRVTAALAEVGLTMPETSSPGTLSGGESQRLALAGALVMEPRVLLLDEPTAMLDPDTAATVRAVVDEIASRRGLTVVVVEHRLDGWLDQVDRLVVLDAAGRIIADGDPGAVLDEHRDALAAQGIWVPGVPDPEPLELHLPAVPTMSAAVVAPGEVAVAARDVTVVHRSRRLGAEPRVTVAVRDQDLDVAAGRTLALVGPSGAGKSTLMAAAGGLIAPTSGTVDFAERLIDPDDRTRPPAKWASKHLARSVSWVPQRAATAIVGHTVREDVLTTARAIGLDEAAAGMRADTLLQALGLADLAHADPRTLSGGEQRRLAVASAIAHGPALVLADEPTVGQDRLTWSAVMGVLATAEQEGSAVLVTTHDSGVVARAAQTIELHAPCAPPSVRGNPGAPVTSDYLDPAEPASVRGNPGAPVTSDYLDPAGSPGKGATHGLADPREASERHTLLSRAGPLGLLLAALSVIVLPALLQNWRQGVVVLTVEVSLGAVALLAPGPGRRPTGRVRGVLLRLAPAMLAVLGVGWSSWLLGGRDIEVATGAALRVLCLVVPSAFVVAYLDPERLGDHLAQRLRLPARAVVAASAALQRVQSFDVLWNELMTTRRVRGIRADHGLVAKVREAGAVTVGLLVGALGQAAVLALAMDSRGFAGAHRRTWAGTAPWRVADSIAVAAGLLIIGAAVAARVIWPG